MSKVECVIKNLHSVQAYFGLIEEIEPEKVLDVGMLLKRIGSCTRMALQHEISDEIELTGVDLFPEIEFEIWNKVYDEIWNFNDFLKQQKNECYDLAVLLDIFPIISVDEQEKLWNRIRGRARYILVDTKQLIPSSFQGKINALTIGGVQYFLLHDEGELYGN